MTPVSLEMLTEGPKEAHIKMFSTHTDEWGFHMTRNTCWVQFPYSETYNSTAMFQPYSPNKKRKVVPTFLRNLLNFLNMNY